MLWQASLSTPRWYSDKLVTGIFILPVVRCLGSVPWPRVKMDAGRVSTYSSFARRIWQHRALVMGPRVCFCIQQGRKPVLVTFFPMVLQVSSSKSGWWVHIAPTSATRLGGAGRNHFRVLAHFAQYEEANEAIITRTIFCYRLVSTPWSSLLWLLRLCCVFFWCFVYAYSSRSPLGMAASTLGRLHGIFSHGPEMLIPLTPNGLIVFCHDLLTYPYRPAGESLVLQTWLMSDTFAPDPLDERIVSLPAEIQGERPACSSQRVRCWYGMRSTTLTMSSSRLGKTRHDFCFSIGTSGIAIVPSILLVHFLLSRQH